MNQKFLSIKYYSMGSVTRGSGCGTKGRDIQTRSMNHIPIIQWAQEINQLQCDTNHFPSSNMKIKERLEIYCQKYASPFSYVIFHLKLWLLNVIHPPRCSVTQSMVSSSPHRLHGLIHSGYTIRTGE